MAGPAPTQLSSEEIAYKDKIIAMPCKVEEEGVWGLEMVTASLSFKADKNSIAMVRARSQEYLSQYSNMKLEATTDYLISTYMPKTTSAFDYGYKVIIKPDGNNFTVDVKCSSAKGSAFVSGPKPKPDMHAKMLANYLRTGEIYPKFIYYGENYKAMSIWE